MTIKERLFNEWCAIQQQIAECKGETFTTRYNPDTNMMKEWKEWIERAKRTLEEAQKQKRVRDYYETEEGRQYKATRESRLADIRQEIMTMATDTENELRAYVKAFLGKEFDLSFGFSRCEIGIVKKVHDNGGISFYHSFDVYFEIDRWLNKGFEFKVNFGTSGSFDPMEDTTYAAFVVALGKFVGGHAGFRDICKDFAKKYDALKSEKWDIERELESPKLA